MKKNLKVLSLALVLLLAFSLSACSTESAILSSAADDLEFFKYDPFVGPKVNNKYMVDYINYDEIFLGENEIETFSGRYSNQTADGKMKWEFEKDYTVVKTIIKDRQEFSLHDKFTIGGKKITFPCKFSDLGEEYAIFDKVDFNKINKKVCPFILKDKKTGVMVYIDDYYINLGGFGFVALYGKNNTYVADLIVKYKDGTISWIDASSEDVFSLIDLRIAGIGVGSSLNEVYEVLGMPNNIGIKRSNLPTLEYKFISNNNSKRTYSINIYCDEDMYDFRYDNEHVVRNNVVTGIDIRSNEED